MCPACGAQYLAWVTRCADCGVALLDAGPSVLDLPDDEQLVYELAEWTPARRTLLESLLGADGIGHAWEAADLVVHVDDESRVDALVEAIEQGGVAGAATAEQAGLDGDQLVYELDAWSVDDRHKLGEALLGGGRAVRLGRLGRARRVRRRRGRGREDPRRDRVSRRARGGHRGRGVPTTRRKTRCPSCSSPPIA